MDTARLDLCKELYKRSGWNNTYHRWSKNIYGKDVVIDTAAAGSTTPAYDLGYLLRRLPKNVTEFWGKFYPASPCLMYSGTQWVIFYQSTMTGEHNTDELFGQFADHPEDAACLLAIELFKQRVLKKE